MSTAIEKGPFRYDIVGSFLRTPEIKEARQAFEAGTLDKAGLRKVENEEIAKLVDKELAVGLKAVTDGEYRRSFWHLDFLENLKGITHVKADAWSVKFKSHQPKAVTIEITDTIDFEDHPFVEDFKEFNAIVNNRAVAKMTIPSPSMLHLICCVRNEHFTLPACYNSEDEIFEDIAKAYKKALHAFYEAGCRYLQLDDTSWGEFCDAEKRKAYAARGIDVDKVGQKYVEVINKVLEDKPADLTVTMHICRGNFRSTWFSSGGYDAIAPILFDHCKVDGFFLEYDSDRAGGFTPLRHIKDQKVVLGLVTSKFADLEKEEDIIERINEATLYVPKEQLCISPQCGFASTEEGNAITDDDQWKKLSLLKSIAEKVW